ncbi:MAG: GNAT family N-acetyltransferase [Pseudobdellovibrionaceae bacterium]
MRKTKRLILRPLSLHDYENWRQAYSMLHPAKNEWDEGPWKESELTLLKFKKLLKNLEDLKNKDQLYEFAIFRKDDGVFIGQVGLMNISRMIFQNAYLGYRIFNNYWGEGYASEACRAAIEIAFKDLKLHRIEAGIEPHNKLSLRVAKAVGLRKEGISLKRLLVQGKWKDMVIYAGTCEDFGMRYKK